MKIYDERYQEFLRRLRRAREDAGLSQCEAARRLGKTQAFIWKCEVGERRATLVYGAGNIGLMGECALAVHAAGGRA